MGNLLAPPPKEFVSEDLDDEDNEQSMDEDENGLVQLHCTWSMSVCSRISIECCREYQSSVFTFFFF